MRGKIIRGIGGFYYVSASNEIYECKAKGIFRKDHKKPLVGDDVEMDVLDADKKLGNIREILERKSELIRPAVANVDQALVIFAITKPAPNFGLLDRFLIMMERQKLSCSICFTKLDLDDAGEAAAMQKVYEDCGYQTLTVSSVTGEGIEEVKELLRGRTTTVAGPSGVGKSSLINRLLGTTIMETGAISDKIDRGKHTTRHTELLQVEENTFVLDTPGFSSLGLFDVTKEELGFAFREFVPFEAHCKFAGCSHITEPVCGIRDALAEGKISKMRYESYCQIYDELKQGKKYSN